MELWIARDNYGLWLFKEQPIKTISNGDKFFKRSGNMRYSIDCRLFPEVTFENSPQKIKIELV